MLNETFSVIFKHRDFNETKVDFSIIDATKYTTTLKRPVAQRAQDIGVWLTIIQTLTYVSVLTNGLVIAMTSDFIPKLVYQYGTSNSTNLEGFREWTLTSKCLNFENNFL